uniref:PIN domain-containing protein n=1 Tax=Parascaris equorum TaxID=6256 RepID=A0A914S463_PAREQ
MHHIDLRPSPNVFITKTYKLCLLMRRSMRTFRPQISSAMFLKYNSQLGPPFHVIVDTNFVNFSIKYRIDMMQGFMDCLYAKTIPYITDCHKCYMVATCDKDLKRRIRKIPGIPIMYIRQHRYSIERMPDAYGAPMF